MAKKKDDKPKLKLVRPPKESKEERCQTCHQPLTIEGGYGGTGMCGPCATGDADTMDEIGETW